MNILNKNQMYLLMAVTLFCLPIYGVILGKIAHTFYQLLSQALFVALGLFIVRLMARAP